MSKKTFSITHSETTAATPKSVYSLWADINQWPRWDLGLDACELTTEFKRGATFKLTPKGAPEPVEAKIKEIIENQKFVDVTDLPFGRIEATHEVVQTKGGSVVTHTITAEIAEEKAAFFANVIWKNMEHGLAPSVKALTQLAEKSSKSA
jgi:uncharacterized protein YndB with AHSA1/START domain